MKLAFVFRTAPHGSSIAREGLDALLAATAFCDEEEIGVFFLDEGILNLLVDQKPDIILQKDFTAAFKLLDLYDIENRFVCSESMQYAFIQDRSIINVEALPYHQWLSRLQQAEKVFTF
ncbi:tRNA 2-thiouridine(34) synthase TusC [Actinobacillus delphinicola]|uniref:sulfurtransferase complex subunit TusC n=1 Tax=Actinobacillus delphinicola TaxID=51161 RepID=UPI002442375B|nr:sulfurtransferase complex subunit TusC [Actinobacillus delphinicola]MDG6897463.1 tRNA 2-thiouridine(34) synthase TusC [Actinobacillus delphinicola]